MVFTLTRRTGHMLQVLVLVVHNNNIILYFFSSFVKMTRSTRKKDDLHEHFYIIK